MRTVRILLFAILCIHSISAHAQWIAAGSSSAVNSIAVEADSGMVFAMSDNGLRKSGDAGATWQTIPDPKFGGTSYPFTRVWGISRSGDLYANVGFRQARSTNRGTDWTLVKVTP